VVRGDKLRLRTDIDISADSTAKKVHLSGKTSIVEGYVELFDRRYDVDRAVVVFDEAHMDDSTIDLQISRQFPEVQVIASISGTVGAPKIEMRSEPPLYSEAQVVSLIINGTPAGKTGEDSTNDAALSAIAGLVSQQLANSLTGPLNIDSSFELNTEEGGKISSLSVGIWLSDNIFGGYFRHFEADPNENQDEVVLEWWLKPTWLMEVRTGDAGASSGDLLWIWRY
jgi:autotransporter translocation and assembly factor TamB